MRPLTAFVITFAGLLLWAALSLGASAPQTSTPSLSGSTMFTDGTAFSYTMVVLMTADGVQIAETQEQAEGQFAFYDVAPGNYILKVRQATPVPRK
jgi:hypothetical protein